LKHWKQSLYIINIGIYVQSSYIIHHILFVQIFEANIQQDLAI
jgi:hypothetical protein